MREVFEWVQAMPYATDAAHNASELRRLRSGDCVAKAQLLGEELQDRGAHTRLVCWEYALPKLVPAQHDLAFTTDIHTSLQIRHEGNWLLADATHDPTLAKLGLTVSTWDEHSGTVAAYPPLGPIWGVGNPLTPKP